jgi:signal transduction histidine kinase
MAEAAPERSDRAATATVIENGLLNAYLAIRVVHLVQGLICVTTGWRSYRRPGVAAAVLAGVTAESAWLLRRVARLRTVDPVAARVETATSMVGLVALASATPVTARTTSMNWMLPYSVASTLGLAVSSNRAEAVADVSALTTTYLATTLRPKSWSGHVVTALTNAASYGGFHGVAAVVVNRGRQDGRDVDRIKAESAAHAEKLSAERERNRQHRLLHDSALQTLELIGSGYIEDTEVVRERARAEAQRLRLALAGIEPDDVLDEALSQLCIEFAGHGLQVDYTNGGIPELSMEASKVLSDAAREALRNVVKHASVGVAVVRAAPHEGGVQLTVRDHGAGFEVTETESGFGLRQSVTARVEEVGGSVAIWSEPGRGTRVTLWAPSP